MKDASRIALGSAQFGLVYGVANRAGQVPEQEVRRILECARAGGVDTLDTAIAYGESETRLGEIGVQGWKVISKLPPIPDECSDAERWIVDQCKSSLQRLRITRLRGLLLHQPMQLLGPRGDVLRAALARLKDAGLVEKIGFSVYGPEELDSLWPLLRPDLVQAPFNVIDRRLLASGWLQRLHDAGVEVHVRSAFLQGLLLMARDDRPAAFSRWDGTWGIWHRWLATTGYDPVHACLQFAAAQNAIDRIVVGVDGLPQAKHIFEFGSSRTGEPPAELALDDPDLVNPARWKK